MNYRSNIATLLCALAPLLVAFPAGAADAPAAAPAAAAAPAPAAANGADAKTVAAVRLAKSNRCMKCHGTFKKKEGPSYPAIAANYKGKPDAEETLMRHITSGKTITRTSGLKEHHKSIMNKSEDQLRNLVKWILAE